MTYRTLRSPTGSLFFREPQQEEPRHGTRRFDLTGSTLITGVIGLVLLTIVSVFIFWVGWVNFVDNYELPYKFDARTGAITILPESGYQVTPPLVVSVHHIDLRPMQVCINANQPVLNCKLVQFDPKGIELFLSWHGRGDYDGPGTKKQETTFSEILKSYAFDGSGKNYPFLKVTRELRPEEATDPGKK